MKGIKNKSLNPQSILRIKKNELYFPLVKQLKELAKKNNTFNCLFCGNPLTDADSEAHHTNGRDGEMILAKHYLRFAHHICHTKYHSNTFEQLSKEVWYKAFLYRLKMLDEELYNKEINKSLPMKNYKNDFLNIKVKYEQNNI